MPIKVKATKKAKKQESAPVVTTDPIPTLPPVTEPETVIPEPPKKKKLSDWQLFVGKYAKENPKCGRELFKRAYASYKCSAAK
jgi:hypothetical protein